MSTPTRHTCETATWWVALLPSSTISRYNYPTPPSVLHAPTNGAAVQQRRLRGHQRRHAPPGRRRPRRGDLLRRPAPRRRRRHRVRAVPPRAGARPRRRHRGRVPGGLAGACCRATPLLWAYLLLTGLLILAAACFGVFALVVTNAGAGRAVSGRGFREYHLGDYSTWLRRSVEDGGHWARIRSCLVDTGVCRSLKSNQTLDEFVNSNLSPLQVPIPFELLHISPNLLNFIGNILSNFT